MCKLLGRGVGRENKRLPLEGKLDFAESERLMRWWYKLSFSVLHNYGEDTSSVPANAGSPSPQGEGLFSLSNNKKPSCITAWLFRVLYSYNLMRMLYKADRIRPAMPMAVSTAGASRRKWNSRERGRKIRAKPPKSFKCRHA